MAITITSIVLLILAFLIMIVGFLMSPNSNSFSGALIGSSDLELFSKNKEKGYKKFLKWSMIFLGFSMFLVVILIRIFL